MAPGRDREDNERGPPIALWKPLRGKQEEPSLTLPDKDPEREVERLLADEMHNTMAWGPYPFEHIKPRLRDRIPPALKWWLFGFCVGVMLTVVALEMFTNLDLGLVPNGPQ